MQHKQFEHGRKTRVCNANGSQSSRRGCAPFSTQQTPQSRKDCAQRWPKDDGPGRHGNPASSLSRRASKPRQERQSLHEKQELPQLALGTPAISVSDTYTSKASQGARNQATQPTASIELTHTARPASNSRRGVDSPGTNQASKNEKT